jgi:hypothetical protein
MRTLYLVVAGFALLLAGYLLARLNPRPESPPQQAAPNTSDVPFKHGSVIAASGGAEISAIRCIRTKVRRGVPEADLTNTELELWLPLETKGELVNTSDTYLVRLTELAPILDDTGKLLSTPERVAGSEFLKSEVRASRTYGVHGKDGPVVQMTLDIPSRQASAIKAVTGKGQVTRVKTETLNFDKLSTRLDKPLEDTRFGAFKVEPRLVIEDGTTTFKLRVPNEHSRLIAWAIFTNGRERPFIVESATRVGPDKWDLYRKYSGDVSDSSLRIALAVPVEAKNFEFDFQNVALP